MISCWINPLIIYPLMKYQEMGHYGFKGNNSAAKDKEKQNIGEISFYITVSLKSTIKNRLKFKCF